MNKIIEALKLAQNQIGPNRESCDEYEKKLWDVYEEAIDLSDKMSTYFKSLLIMADLSSESNGCWYSTQSESRKILSDLEPIIFMEKDK